VNQKNQKTIEFTIPNMNCQSCVGKITQGLNQLDSELKLNFHLPEKKVEVIMESDKTKVRSISEKLSAIGFPSTSFSSK
jgi:copper chaperone CopZ